MEQTKSGKFKFVEQYTDYMTGKKKRVSVTMEKNTAATRRIASETQMCRRDRHSIVEDCHEKAREMIMSHEEVLHKCAKLLLEKEKIHRDEFEALFTEEKGVVLEK